MQKSGCGSFWKEEAPDHRGKRIRRALISINAAGYLTSSLTVDRVTKLLFLYWQFFSSAGKILDTREGNVIYRLSVVNRAGL